MAHVRISEHDGEQPGGPEWQPGLGIGAIMGGNDSSDLVSSTRINGHSSGAPRSWPRPRCPDEGTRSPVAHFALDPARCDARWSELSGSAPIHHHGLGRGPLLRGRSAVWGSGFGGSYANRRGTCGAITLSHALASLQGRSAISGAARAALPASGAGRGHLSWPQRPSPGVSRRPTRWDRRVATITRRCRSTGADQRRPALRHRPHRPCRNNQARRRRNVVNPRPRRPVPSSASEAGSGATDGRAGLLPMKPLPGAEKVITRRVVNV